MDATATDAWTTTPPGLVGDYFHLPAGCDDPSRAVLGEVYRQGATLHFDPIGSAGHRHPYGRRVGDMGGRWSRVEPPGLTGAEESAEGDGESLVTLVPAFDVGDPVA